MQPHSVTVSSLLNAESSTNTKQHFPLTSRASQRDDKPPTEPQLTNMPAKIAPETLVLIKGWPLFYRIDLIRRNRDRWPFFQSMTDADVMAWLHKHDL